MPTWRVEERLAGALGEGFIAGIWTLCVMIGRDEILARGGLPVARLAPGFVRHGWSIYGGSRLTVPETLGSAFKVRSP